MALARHGKTSLRETPKEPPERTTGREPPAAPIQISSDILHQTPITTSALRPIPILLSPSPNRRSNTSNTNIRTHQPYISLTRSIQVSAAADTERTYMLKAFARSSLRFFSSTRSLSSPRSGSSRLLAQTLALSVPSAVAVSALAFADKDSAAFTLWPISTLWPVPSTMTLPPPLPAGRPGNLTPEEEAKLKQLWHATLLVFGVTTPDPSTTASPPTEPEAEPETFLSPESKKKSKKPLGRFLSRKGKPEKESTEKLANEVVAVVDTSDDKYGQTKEFKAALASQTPEELRDAFWGMVKCDNPDGLLLRFLRARKWDVDKALVMMVATMNWRGKEMNVQEVISKGELGYSTDADQGFTKQLRMGKSFLHGTDKDGRPICVVRVRLHKQADQSEESLERYTVYIMETARLMLRDPVDTAAVVFDMSGFSMANMDYAPVKYLIKCFEAHYPESLGICLVHKAPWIFQSIWSIIRGWLDPVVASKIHFTKTVEDMEAYIPRSNILAELGGDDNWEYTYVEPIPGENRRIAEGAEVRERLQAKRESQVREFEELTRRWVKGEETGEGRKRVAEGLRVGYWEVDPYMRARTVYDRTGVIGEDGRLDFYGYKNKGKGVEVETSADDID